MTCPDETSTGSDGETPIPPSPEALPAVTDTPSTRGVILTVENAVTPSPALSGCVTHLTITSPGLVGSLTFTENRSVFDEYILAYLKAHGPGGPMGPMGMAYRDWPPR